MKTSRSPGPVRRLLALTAVLALTAAACAAEDGETAAAVEISDNRYQPSEVEVPSGASVTWTNQDAVPHTVTFDDREVASSDQLAEGQSFTAVFERPGTYAYVCAVHPEMAATVTVTG